MRQLIVFGASGHARVIIDAARLAGWEVVGVIDPGLSTGAGVEGAPWLGSEADLAEIIARFPEASAIAGGGDWRIRERVAAAVGNCSPGLPFATVIHPRATISPSALVGAGTFIAANAAVNCGCRIGAHVVVNTCAGVDHDVILEDFSFVGPNAALAGSVRVGRRAFIGVGASVLPNLRIGDGAILGGGSTAVTDIPPGATYAGVPARPLRS